MFCRRVPASRKLRTLAAAAAAALALSACGGGGGSSGSSGGPTSTLGRSPTAGGVTASLTHDGTNQNIVIKKGGTEWTEVAHNRGLEPSGWKRVTRLNAHRDMGPTERFYAVGRIASSTDQDYLLYGYWASLPIDKLDDYKPFYYGKTPYTGNVLALTGTVTYSGGAAGVYQEEGDSTQARGDFTSDNAKFTVTFSATGAMAQLILRDMEAYTDEVTIGPEFGASATGQFKITGASFAGTHASNGSTWGGQFYGPSSATPTGVLGWFKSLRVWSSGAGKWHRLYGVFGGKR